MSEQKSQPARKTLLVVIDETPECKRAVYFAMQRAARIGGQVAALCAVASDDFQHWLGVETLMRQEAEAEAHNLMDRVLGPLSQRSGIEPQRHVKFGPRTEVIGELVGEDPSIAQLILGAAQGPEGPGPLVSAIAGGQAGGYPIPITIVPATLTDDVIDTLA